MILKYYDKGSYGRQTSGFAAVCMANPAAWLAADLFLLPVYFHYMKKLAYLET